MLGLLEARLNRTPSDQLEDSLAALGKKPPRKTRPSRGRTTDSKQPAAAPPSKRTTSRAA